MTTADKTPLRYRTPTVDVDATVSLDEFRLEDIIGYLRHQKREDVIEACTGKAEKASIGLDIEGLYYATRGDGPIPAPVADRVRAHFRDLAGRA